VIRVADGLDAQGSLRMSCLKKILIFAMLLDEKKKKWRTQQEGARARRVHALLQLLAVCRKGQGHQALHRP
jgi:hypothetical protein